MQAHWEKVIGESEIIFPEENNYWKSRPGLYSVFSKSEKPAMWKVTEVQGASELQHLLDFMTWLKTCLEMCCVDRRMIDHAV